MKEFYFGSAERMAWVPCPAIEADISNVGWSTSGRYLNGGGYARRSTASGRAYQFSWNLTSADNIYKVLNYADGVYGPAPYYFLDPFAIETNLLPTYWAAPRIAASDGPSLVKDKRPTLVATAINTLDYPTKSAVYTLVAGDKFAALFIPVPPGYTFHFGAHGSATGTAGLTVTPTGGAAVAQTLISSVSTARTNYSVGGVTGVTISATGAGQLTLSGLMAQVRPTGVPVPMGGFISGRGNSGCEFDGLPTTNGYSSALDLQGASAKLIEVAAWL